MAGDVGCAQHLAADVAGDLPFMSDHVGAQSVFGGEGRSTGLGEDRTRSEGQARGTLLFIVPPSFVPSAALIIYPTQPAFIIQTAWNMSNYKGL